MSSRSFVGPRFRRQNFAAVIGAEKKEGPLIERRHRDHLDRNALGPRHVFDGMFAAANRERKAFRAMWL